MIKKIWRSYKYRIYPTKSQKSLFLDYASNYLFVYDWTFNAYLSDPSIIKTDPTNAISALQNDKTFLTTTPLSILRASFVEATMGIERQKLTKETQSKHLRKRNGLNFRFVYRKRLNLSSENHVELPFLGSMKISYHRNIPESASISQLHFSKTADDKYFMNVLFSMDAIIQMAKKKTIKVLGLDYSTSTLYVSSNNERFEFPKKAILLNKRLKSQLEKLRTHETSSKNYARTSLNISKTKFKLRNLKKDWINKITTSISESFDVVVIENINLNEMIRKSKGLAKNIYQENWSDFKNILKYKLDERGKRLIVVSRWFKSSKMCSNCGFVKEDLQITDRIYICPSCGLKIDRDYNAAINLKHEGIRLLKQELRNH
ncbi:MAG: transposase [Bacilli bacterium]|nr:transposase [Bacilli bacterium]